MGRRSRAQERLDVRASIRRYKFVNEFTVPRAFSFPNGGWRNVEPADIVACQARASSAVRAAVCVSARVGAHGIVPFPAEARRHRPGRARG